MVPSLAPPPQAAPGSKGVCPALVNTLGPTPLQLNRCPKQRNRAQMKEHTKTPERELSDEEIANLSDVEFKTLVIHMLTEMIELN